MEFRDPLHHDLGVAQIAQALEQALARFFHRPPVGIGIHGHQAVSHRAAAAQCDPQIMHGISTEIGRNAIALMEHAQHPVAQTGRFGSGFQVVGRREVMRRSGEYSSEVLLTLTC